METINIIILGVILGFIEVLFLITAQGIINARGLIVGFACFFSMGCILGLLNKTQRNNNN